jgi:hypothetical protein
VPDLGAGFFSRVHAAVVRKAGTGSRWNGWLGYITPGQQVHEAGWSYPSGRIDLSRPLVVQPLARMFSRGPDSLRVETFAARCWMAIETVVHELNHHNVPDGWTLEQQRASMADAALEPIRESFDEAYSLDITPEVVDEALGPRFARLLHRVRAKHGELIHSSYPDGNDAARAFAAELDKQLGIPRAEVLWTAGREPDTRKAAALGDLILRASRLSPGAGRAEEVSASLAAIVHNGFAGLNDTNQAARVARNAVELVMLAEGRLRTGGDLSVVRVLAGQPPAADAVAARPSPAPEAARQAGQPQPSRAPLRR